MEKSFIKDEKEFKKINASLKKVLDIISGENIEAIIEFFCNSSKIICEGKENKNLEKNIGILENKG